jgi:hypothetical protein
MAAWVSRSVPVCNSDDTGFLSTKQINFRREQFPLLPQSAPSMVPRDGALLVSGCLLRD